MFRSHVRDQAPEPVDAEMQPQPVRVNLDTSDEELDQAGLLGGE